MPPPEPPPISGGTNGTVPERSTNNRSNGTNNRSNGTNNRSNGTNKRSNGTNNRSNGSDGTVQYSLHRASPPARPLCALASAAYPAHGITALIAKGRARVVPKSDPFLK